MHVCAHARGTCMWHMHAGGRGVEIKNIWKREKGIDDYLWFMQEKLHLDIPLCPALQMSILN